MHSSFPCYYLDLQETKEEEKRIKENRSGEFYLAGGRDRTKEAKITRSFSF